MAGASVSQSGANVVLRGAPSILRKRSILSKRQCEHCRSCCVYAVGLSVALYAVPVASSHRGGFKYAAHTPAAVCGWRPEQNLAAVVPESVSVHVCVCGFLSVCCFFFAKSFLFWFSPDCWTLSRLGPWTVLSPLGVFCQVFFAKKD